jgi:hypothetical protein
MSGYDVQIEEIRAAGRGARSASDQRRGVDAAGALDGVGAAIVGARAAGLLGTVVARWRQGADYWSGTMGGHADSLVSSADAYATNEEAAARDFQLINSPVVPR